MLDDQKDIIFERKVESDTVIPMIEPEVTKLSTANNSLKTSNSKTNLKRSMTLAKNTFSLNRKDVRKHIKDMSSGKSGGGAGLLKDDLDEAPLKPPETVNGRISRTDSVRNFFSKVVNQISVSRSKSRSDQQADQQSARSEEWRSYFQETQQKVPGVIGIRNHGNTCFINSILQCLSYTDILAEYFVLDQYKSDLRRRRRLAFTKTPTTMGKGEITEQLAMVLKSLWSLQYDPEISDKFKALVDKYGSQYKGGNQHDAQEFLLWLLDKVHEELNTATTKKYKRLKNFPGKSDDALAAESLANYMRCNNSFVVDIFQAQFRSSLTCPTCERQSNTFDPFLCVSLPIPQIQVRPIIITVVYLDQSPRQVRIGLTLPVEADVKDLRESLAKDTGIPTAQLLIAEINDVTFQRTLNDGQAISLIEPSACLYCLEVPTANPENEDNGAFVILSWINVYKEGPIEKRFGSPYIMQVSRETIYGDVQKLLMKEMSSILHDDILIGLQRVPLFKIRVLDGFEDKVYLDEKVELPLYMECVETAVQLSMVQDAGGPVHVKLILEWDMPGKTQVISDDSDKIEEHCSVAQVKSAPESGSSVTLQECFSLYTSEERLGCEDAYFCPQCNKKREVVKKLGVWSVPDVMVVHLKRFRQSTKATNKLDTMVDFPLDGFDMSPNMARGAVPDNLAAADGGPPNGLKGLTAFSPWKHPKRLRTHDRESTVYDLYSVCYHHGSDLLGGHYTSSCKNPTDDQWYSFDDTHTKQIGEEEVVNKDAYILFYQKACLSGASSASSSSSSGGADHWVYRMPDFVYKTKSETRCAPTSKPRSTKSKAPEPNFARNSAKYATLPANKSKELVRPAPEEAETQSDAENGDRGEESSDEDEIETAR